MTKQQTALLDCIRDRQLLAHKPMSTKRIIKKAIDRLVRKLQSLPTEGKANCAAFRMIGHLAFQHDVTVLSYNKDSVSLLISETLQGVIKYREEKVKTATRLYELLNY